MSIVVNKPGVLSTLQDLGRVGYQRFGVVADGVMDERSHRVANALTGNPDREATLEITLMGPSLVFEETTLIAICGANLSAHISQVPLPHERPVLVRAGSQLDFGRRVSGMRAYLAVHGGFDVAPVMHSKSTYLRGAFGGFEGRALRAGDRIAIGAGNPEGVFPRLAGKLNAGSDRFAAADEALLPVAPTPDGVSPTVRVMVGQQWMAFSDAAQEQFLASEFRISPKSDRMGFRIEGPRLELRAPLEMISEAVGFGTIQVPPDGAPIILMADRQTTGGYPKIADVASVDLPVLAQMPPQQPLRFARISVEEAQQLHRVREQEIDSLRQTVTQFAREA